MFATASLSSGDKPSAREAKTTLLPSALVDWLVLKLLAAVAPSRPPKPLGWLSAIVEPASIAWAGDAAPRASASASGIAAFALRRMSPAEDREGDDALG